MLFIILFFCLMLCLLIFKFKRRRMYKLVSAIPGSAEQLPIIGFTHKFSGCSEDIMNTLQGFSYEAMKQDGMVHGWLGNILMIVCLNPVDTETILKVCLEKDDIHRFIRKIIGNGAIFAPVAIWRKRRKILVPAFTPKIIDNFVEIFSRHTQKLVSNLDECVGREKFSVWPFLSSYTFDVVCESAMGIKINAQDDPNTAILKSMQILLNIVCKRIFHLWLQPDWLFKFFPEYPIYESNVKAVYDFTDEVIRKKRHQLKGEKRPQSEIDKNFDLRCYKERSFLDLLINFSGAEKGYNNVELREEIMTLAVAGTDTSAVSMGYTLKLLAKYPKIQEKLFKELQEVFGDSDRLLIKEDLLQLKFLDRVVKESLRLFPPVPIIMRKVLEDISLPSGKVLPAGSTALVSIWGVHRDPKYWGPDAECFDPDRFLPERFRLKHPCNFMPFSNGPRNCVGYQYALRSVKVAVSSIVRRYKIVGEEESGPIPHIKCKLDIMMKDVDDYKIGLVKRPIRSK